MNETPIDLRRFISQSIDELLSFQSYWTKKHRDDPKNYPIEIEAGEWEEQFAAWQIRRE